MATALQRTANKINAQRSTGPKTEEGKAKSRMNATRHGLCAFITCMDDDDPEEAQTLLAQLKEEHQPANLTEEILVFKMAEQFYLTRRAGYYLTVHTMYNEASALGPCKNEDADDEPTYDGPKQVGLYLRYYNSADRAFNRNLHDLRKLQKERQQREAEEQIGFVPQTAEEAPAETPAPTQSDPPKEPTYPQSTFKSAADTPIETVFDAPNPSDPERVPEKQAA